MSESQFRSKIYWVTFCFSIFVIWVHSTNWELFLGQPGMETEAEAVRRVEYFFGERLGQMAVPGFFLVSAYLFYRNFTMDRLLSKWKSRIFSVALPYVLWNLLYYGGYVLGSRIPGLGTILNREPVPVDWKTVAEAAFFYRYNPVFWYLFQLILLILLAPVLYLLLKRNGTAALFLAFLAFSIFKGWRLGALNTDALFYYSFGAWAALHREKHGAFVERGWGREWILPGTVLTAWTLTVWWFSRSGSILYNNPFATVTFRLAMAAGTWALVSFLPLGEAREFMKHNFFLYAVHFAGVRFVNKAGAMLFSGSAAAAWLFFLLMPPAMIVVSRAGGWVLQKTVPGFYRILSGGR